MSRRSFAKTSSERKASRFTRKVRASQSSWMNGLRRFATFTRGAVVVWLMPAGPPRAAVSLYDTLSRIATRGPRAAARSKRQIGSHRDADEAGQVRERHDDTGLLAARADAHGDAVAARREAHDVAALARERVVVDLDRRLPGEHVHVAVPRCGKTVALLPRIEALREHEHRRGPGEARCGRMHVPAQLAEPVPIDREVGTPDEGRRMERGALPLTQLDERGERRRGRGVRRSHVDGGSDLRGLPLRRARLRLELDHLRAEPDDERLVDDAHELRGAIVARAEVLVVEAARDDREQDGVLGAPVEAMAVHDAVPVSLDAEDRDASLVRMAAARHAGVVAHEHDPLREGELLELRHDVELARALTAVDHRHVGPLDVDLAVMRALVEFLPAHEEALVVARRDRGRDGHAGFLPFTSPRPSSGRAPNSRDSCAAVASSARAIGEVRDSGIDEVVPTMATAAVQWSPWNTGAAIARMPGSTSAASARPSLRMRRSSAASDGSRRSARRRPGTSLSGRKAQNTRPWLERNGVRRAPVWMLMRTSRSGLSSTRTTMGASPSQMLMTTVSFTRRTSASMCGPAMVTMGRPAPAAAASVSTCGPSVYSFVAGSKRSRLAWRSATV